MCHKKLRNLSFHHHHYVKVLLKWFQLNGHIIGLETLELPNKTPSSTLGVKKSRYLFFAIVITITPKENVSKSNSAHKKTNKS